MFIAVPHSSGCLDHCLSTSDFVIDPQSLQEEAKVDGWFDTGDKYSLPTSYKQSVLDSVNHLFTMTTIGMYIPKQ